MSELTASAPKPAGGIALSAARAAPMEDGMAWFFPASTISMNAVSTLNGQDDLYVDEGVLLATTTNTPTVSAPGGSHEIIVYGTVFGAGTTLVIGNNAAADTGNEVYVRSGGRVESVGNTSFATTIYGTGAQLENEGEIISQNSHGIYLLSAGSGGASTINNSGLIDARSVGIIRGPMAQETLVFTNSGTIRSGGTAFSDESISARDEITNTGTIIGQVEMGNGDDVYSGAAGRLSGLVNGGDGNDIITTGIDNDVIFGGAGVDTMRGKGGNDYYFVDRAADKVIEVKGQGQDTVQSEVSFTLSANVEKLLLNTTKNVSGTGNALANFLQGFSGNNALSGLGGNDVLSGGSGQDTLRGGIGKDTFIFASALAAANRDKITDFSAPDDVIRIENTVFKKLTKAGVLSESMFKLGTKAADANDHIIYNKATGGLFYDADGSGSGAQVLFATLTNKAAISHLDFFVI